MRTVRTRIAPSPTGEDLHIGNAYTALINYVFAKKNKGQFIVRIEDTDRTRLISGAEEKILSSLQWLGIVPDEAPGIGGPHAPYRQSERLSQYKMFAEQLIEAGHAYYCFCTPERLAHMRASQEERHEPSMYDGLCKGIKKHETRSRIEKRETYVIRLNVPDEGTTTFKDVIRGEISFENTLIDDQVLLKSDGFPTYHLCVVVDDHLMGISHIIRGEEWISSTPKHLLLFDFFGWEKPVFAHMPLLRNPDKSKLSKRKNPVWVSWFRQQGYLPEAMLNYLATMAWAFPGGRDVFSIDEMMEQFSLENIQTTAPIFNIDKLRWFNGEYLRSISDEDLMVRIFQHGTMLKQSDRAHLSRIIPLLKERMKTLNEFWSLAGFFFERPKEFEKPLDPKLLRVLKNRIGTVDWSHKAMETAIRQLAEDHGLKARDVFMELRIAATGKSVGPPLLESLEILGKEETLKRLEQT